MRLYSARGMTLLEIMIASALLSVIALMSLVAIQHSGTQAHFTANRADLSRRGNAVIIRLERELEGGSYAGQDDAVGTLNAGAVDTLPAGTAACDAIEFEPITGYDLSVAPNGETITGPAVIYAFEQVDTALDTDNDGFLSEFRLVRISGGIEVVIQDNILAVGQTGLASGTAVVNPTFLLTAPSDLTITFSVGAVVGFSNGTRQLVARTVTRNLNLRNLNQ